MTKAQLENYELTHDRAGNGYAWLADIDSVHCRIIEAYPQDQKSPQAFLAAWSKLSVSVFGGEDMVLKPEVIAELEPLRAGVKSGKLVVKNMRLVKA